MLKPSIEVRLISSESADERIALIMETFSAESLRSIIENNPLPEDEVGKIWKDSYDNLISCLIDLYVSERSSGRMEPGSSFSYFSDLAVLKKAAARRGVSAAVKAKLKKYLDEMPKVKTAKDKSKAEQKCHNHLMLLVDLQMTRINRKLHDIEHGKQVKKSVGKGDVIAEGPGFEVFVSDNYKNKIRYPEGNTAVILVHDTKDGHFLILERYNELEQGFILEMPKIPGSLRESHVAASMYLRDHMGMTLREVEKIGEIKPDTHLIKGTCNVFYCNFDQEENFLDPSKDIRAVKRITEEGVYQAAFDGRITCAATLSAMAIWRAFEAVRKKRLANSRRVRPSKSAPDDEDE